MTFRNSKRHDPALRPVCEAIAHFAGRLAGATHAVLINANAVKLNVGGIERGGTLLLIRFPAAAIAREEQPLQQLITREHSFASEQPKTTYTIHTQTETLDGQPPGYSVDAAAPGIHETSDPRSGLT